MYRTEIHCYPHSKFFLEDPYYDDYSKYFLHCLRARNILLRMTLATAPSPHLRVEFNSENRPKSFSAAVCNNEVGVGMGQKTNKQGLTSNKTGFSHSE